MADGYGGWRPPRQPDLYNPAQQAARPRYPPMRPPSPTYPAQKSAYAPRHANDDLPRGGPLPGQPQRYQPPLVANRYSSSFDSSDPNRAREDEERRRREAHLRQRDRPFGAHSAAQSAMPSQRFEIPYRDRSPRKRPREDWDDRFARRSSPPPSVVGDSYVPANATTTTTYQRPGSPTITRATYPRRSPSPQPSSSTNAWPSRRTPSPSPDRGLADRFNTSFGSTTQNETRRAWSDFRQKTQNRAAPSYYPPMPPQSSISSANAQASAPVMRPWGRDLYRPGAPPSAVSDRDSVSHHRSPSPSRTASPAPAPSLSERIGSPPVPDRGERWTQSRKSPPRPSPERRPTSDTPTPPPEREPEQSRQAGDSEPEDGEVVDEANRSRSPLSEGTPPVTPPHRLPGEEEVGQHGERPDPPRHVPDSDVIAPPGATTVRTESQASAKTGDADVMMNLQDARPVDEAEIPSFGGVDLQAAAQAALNHASTVQAVADADDAASRSLDEMHAITLGDVSMETITDEKPSRQPSPVASEVQETVPSPPPTPPRDLREILNSLISGYDADVEDATAKAVLEANRAASHVAKQVDVVPEAKSPRRSEIQFTWQPDDLKADAILQPFLLRLFQHRDDRRVKRTLELRAEYKALDADWRAHGKRLNRIKDRLQRRRQRTVPQTPADQIVSSHAAATVGGSYFPDQSATTPSALIGRPNRRGTAASGFAYGDAVRSEAEFLEILATLEHADMRDPTVRANRTAAVVPDMLVDPDDKRELLERSFDDERRVVDDPESFFGIHEPLDFWTEDEIETFCKRYASHPKQFGRIAAELPRKTTQQCVLFYYRMKTTIDFRSLSNQRRDGRRRKPRKRLGPDGNKRPTGPSLLSNLKRARPDEDDEIVASPPPLSPHQRQPAQHQGRASNSSSRPGSSRGVGAPFLASEGTLEAAETLGSLAMTPPTVAEQDDTDDYEPSARASTNLTTGKSRKRKATADGIDTKSTATKRKASSTAAASWSAAEKDKILQLLKVHGKDWNKLAVELKTKTPVQCRNWFQNHSRRLRQAEAAAAAQANGDDEGGDQDSGPPTPVAGDFTVPTGMSVNKAIRTGAAATATGSTAAPKPGFFIDKSRSRLSPRLAAANLPSFDDKSLARAGMQIRTMLNDDPNDSHQATQDARDDWFANDPASNATTEDESEAPQTSSRPLASNQSTEARRYDPNRPPSQFSDAPPVLGRPMDWTYRRATQFPTEPPPRDGPPYASFGQAFYPSPTMRYSPYSPNVGHAGERPSFAAQPGVRYASGGYGEPQGQGRDYPQQQQQQQRFRPPPG